jgi:hypothetical protein
MPTFTWSIDHLKRNIADGGVFRADWRATASSDTHHASEYGTMGFRPDPSSPDFTAFEDLTEDQVLGWVWASPSGDFAPESDDEEALLLREVVEARLTIRLDALANPVTAFGLPWE